MIAVVWLAAGTQTGRRQRKKKKKEGSDALGEEEL